MATYLVHSVEVGCLSFTVLQSSKQEGHMLSI